jgi:hypothetical protein
MLRTPRAYRYSVETAVRFRLSSAGPWVEGQTINVSPTGVLFSTAGVVPSTGAAIELTVALSALGPVVADVSCQARIVRAAETAPGVTVVAAAIESYRFAPRA